MIDESLKKINRIIAILTSLQAKKIVKAQDLADRFGVSLRTIYRDVKTLESAGVPILSEAGIGYSIMEGYRLPPVMFTREEAGSLVTGEKLMKTFSDKSLGGHYESAIVKIKSVLKTYEKDWIDAFEEQIHVNANKQMFNSEITNSLELVIKGIADKKTIVLEYRSVSNETSQREIEPVGVFHENNYWYIMGYCLLREDYRQFRTDRILSIDSTHKRFSRKHGNLTDYFPSETNTLPTIKVRILVDQKITKFLVNIKNHYGFESEEFTDSGVIMTFQSTDIEEAFPRWYLTFADYMEILEPEGLKENVKQLLQRITKKMDRQ